METQGLIRSVSRLSLLASTGASRALVPRAITANSSLPSTRRHKATAGRMRRALNIAPHKSFTAKDPSATPGVDQIIFNPPASVASVFHTPFKFLPKGDPRRRANLAAMFESARPVTTIGSSTTTTTSSSSSSPTPISSGGGGAIASLVSSIKPRAPQGSTTVDSAHLPPRVNHEYYTAQKHHLSPADVAEMRRLRAEDPETWSVLKLARHYNASPIFVIIAIKSSPEHREKLKAHHAKMKEKLNATKARWGPIRTKARQDRKRRRQMLMRGEL